MGQTAHTPTPWELFEQPIANADEAKAELAYQVDHTEPIGPILYMLNAGGKCPALTGCGPTSKANADFIVRAVNSYETLVSALRNLTTGETADKVEHLVNERYGGDCNVIEAMKLAFEVVGLDAALSTAEGGAGMSNAQRAAMEGIGLHLADGFTVVHDYSHQVSVAWRNSEHALLQLEADGENHATDIYGKIADFLIAEEDRQSLAAVETLKGAAA